MMKRFYKQSGFTLAELLITLAILGVIATFTIPKILDSGTENKYNAMAKEVAAMFSGAYQNYKLNNTPTANTSFDDLTPYMNYVSVKTSGQTDDVPTYGGPTTCTAAGLARCLALHNGGAIRYADNRRFGDTSTTSAITIGFDPNAAAGGPETIGLILYFNGRLVSYDVAVPNTMSMYGVASSQTINPNPAAAPSWWDGWGN